MWKRLSLILMLGLGIFGSPSHAQDSANPYLYYFSDELNAFIIERADGTDTRVLGDGLMALTGDAHNIHIDGPGWSSSGQWFSWTATQMSDFGYTQSGSKSYIISVDGSRRLTLLDQLDNAQLLWAADEDLLFVASRQTEPLDIYPSNTSGFVHTFLALIDVTTETIISSVEERVFREDLSNLDPWIIRPRVYRTLDGQHFIAKFDDIWSEWNQPEDTLIYMFDTQGEVIERRIDDLDHDEDRFFYSDSPNISPTGLIVYPKKDVLIVESLFTNAKQRFPLPGQPHGISWDSSGQYAIIEIDGLWFLDTVKGTMTHFYDEWGHGLYIFRRSASNEISLFILEGLGQFYTFELATNTLKELPLDPGDRQAIFAGWWWLDDERPVVIGCTGSNLLVYNYELMTMVFSGEFHASENFDCYSPQLSPDGQYVAYIDDASVIYDIENAFYHVIRPAYRSFDVMPGGEVAWDESSSWLLMFQEAARAGGPPIQHIGIVRADGTQRRDLSLIWGSNSVSIDWLPPQVALASLPPPLITPRALQPERVLHGDDWSFYVNWSEDGRWIATGGLDWEDTIDITIWGAESGEAVSKFEDVEANEQIPWPSNNGDEFVPQDVTMRAIFEWEGDHFLTKSPDGSQNVQYTNSVTQVVDANTGNVVTELLGEQDNRFFSATYSPDGRLLAATNPFEPVRIWYADTWELAAILPSPGQAVAFSPDGTRLAVTASWDVQIWNVEELLAFGVQ